MVVNLYQNNNFDAYYCLRIKKNVDALNNSLQGMNFNYPILTLLLLKKSMTFLAALASFPLLEI